MKIKEWVGVKEQMAQIGRHCWSVPRLFELSKSFPILEIPLNHLYVYFRYEKLTARDFVMHMKAVNDADLTFPIILDEDGEIMDGRHRVMKAMLLGKESILAVRFDENPTPCSIKD